MGSDALSGRNNWQEDSGIRAQKAEQNLYDVFEEAFVGTNYIIHNHPKHLKDLYAQVQLPQEVLAQIYNPAIDFKKKKWGVSPDFAIENRQTKRILFGEIKRQDGWVEGKEPKAGRGNAHERFCKLFAPGLTAAYRRIGKIDNEEILPFWVVFQGDITRDPKRVREISFLFGPYVDNYFMWRPNMTGVDLIAHFNNKLKKYLD